MLIAHSSKSDCVKKTDITRVKAKLLMLCQRDQCLCLILETLIVYSHQRSDEKFLYFCFGYCYSKDHESGKIAKEVLSSQNHLQLLSAWTISLCMWGCMHKNSKETIPSHSLTHKKTQDFFSHSYRDMKFKDFLPHFEPNNPFYTLNLLNHCFNTPLSHDFTATIAVLSSDESCFTGLARKMKIHFRVSNRELSYHYFCRHSQLHSTLILFLNPPYQRCGAFPEILLI